MDTLRKSFKSHGSGKHMRRVSSGAEDNSHEELPILLDHRKTNAAVDLPDRQEVFVKINDEGSSSIRGSISQVDPAKTKIWRESSIIDFFKEDKNAAVPEGFQFPQSSKPTAVVATTEEEDPPSSLIGQFLDKQKASGGYFSLDMDLEMEELKKERNLPESDVPDTPSDSVRRRHKDSMEEDGRRSSRLSNGGADVVRCTSNASFNRRPSFLYKSDLVRPKTKSRLIDPPESRDEGRVPSSSPMRSGMLNRIGGVDDEDDDPFKDEDVPGEYKKTDCTALTMLQWLSLILIIGVLVCTLSKRDWREKNLWKLKLWKWEVLILVLICGRLVSGWMIKIMVFFVERNFMLRKRVLYFAYGIRKAVQNCIWLGLVLMAWHFMLIKKVKEETNSRILEYVTKVLLCLLIGGLLWLVKTLIVKVLASSFHVRSYFDRIQGALFSQYVIQTLSGRPWIEIQNAEEEEERLADEVRKLQNAGATLPADLRTNVFPSPKLLRAVGSGVLIPESGGIARKRTKFSKQFSRKSEAAITIDHLHRLNPNNVSAWNMKRLMTIVQKRHLTTLDEQILDSTEEGSDNKIESEVEAKAAAKKIFSNVARNGRKYICLEDLMRFMEEDEALKTMSLFEGTSESRRICKTSLKNWVVNCFRDRRALALTLNDTKTAVNRLRCVVDVIVGIIIVIIWLLVLDIITGANVVYATSQLALVAFVFGNTCKTVFEAVIFLFVMHPFDVGDRCEIEGVQMVVEEMNILTTTFLRYDNTKIVYPNSTLATKPICNFYRSPDTGDAVDFCVHISTPEEKITVMKQRITSYIENKKEHWYPAPMIVLKEVEELHRLRYAVWFQHKMNFQDMGEKWERRALLLEEMVRIFRELDIQYRLRPTSINVRSMPPRAVGIPLCNSV